MGHAILGWIVKAEPFRRDAKDRPKIKIVSPKRYTVESAARTFEQMYRQSHPTERVWTESVHGVDGVNI